MRKFPLSPLIDLPVSKFLRCNVVKENPVDPGRCSDLGRWGLHLGSVRKEDFPGHSSNNEAVMDRQWRLTEAHHHPSMGRMCM